MLWVVLIKFFIEYLIFYLSENIVNMTIKELRLSCCKKLEFTLQSSLIF